MDIAVAKLASDTLLLDVREITLIADYFVICSGGSDRQVAAISSDIRDEMKKRGVLPMNVEGEAESGWVLMDYTDVIVHVFSPATREKYALEELWGQAKTVLRIE